MSGALEERLAGILPPEGVGRWTRPRDGAVFPLAAPDEPGQFQEVMRLAHRDGLTVQPIGMGSKLSWCRPAPALDLVLSTRRFTGVIDYEAADGTLTARAGTTMAALRELVGGGGHHLSPDVPRPEDATLGGVLAAAQSGIDRPRYGPVRDQVLGSKVLLADGRLAGSGGRLVKNVTGYDLPRAWCGSHGTLCVLLEACLRLHTRPDSRAAGRVRLATRDEALHLADRLRALPVSFVALVVHDLDPGPPEGPWTLGFLLAGDRGLVDWELERLGEIAPEADVTRDEEAAETAAAWRDLELRTGRWPPLALTCRPSVLPANLAALERCARECDLAPRLLVHPTLARALVWFTADDAGGSPPPPERLLAFHEGAAKLPARVQWLDAPAALLEHVDPFGPPTAGLPLMRRLKHALDPTGRLAGGRFHAAL